MTPKPEFLFDKNETDIAVGLSGGGDSMALLHMVSDWAGKQDRAITVHAITVDHNLRLESGAEARNLAEWVQSWPCVRHTVLTWEHDQEMPQSAVMESARNARYDLMKSYCNDNNIHTLCLAHHADDQIETFLFRLAKGSGLDGLSSMVEKANVDDLILYRPLLDWTHQDLIEYCRERNIKWIEDPSNKNENYARPRLRNSREVLEKEGLSGKRLTTTIKRLRRAADALVCEADKEFKNTVSGNEGKLVIQWSALKVHHEEIIIRVFQKALADIGFTQSGYPPKLERVEELVTQLLSEELKGKSATLHGCLISLSKTGDTVEIVRD